MAKKVANANDYNTADIDKLFEKAPRGLVMTGTGYNPGKKTTKKATPAKKKVKRTK